MNVDDLRRRLSSSLADRGTIQVFSLGLPALDDRFPHRGLSRHAVHEIHAASPEDLPAALGFLIALMASFPDNGPIFIVTSAQSLSAAGRLHGHGLNALGLDPGRITLVEARNETEAFWAIEETLRSGAAQITVGLIAQSFDLKKSQRLSLAARESRRPLLLLRPPKSTASSAVETRWRIAAAPAHRCTSGGLIASRWRVMLERCRNGSTGEWVLEWSHASHRFSLVTALADPALPDSAGLVRGHSA